MRSEPEVIGFAKDSSRLFDRTARLGQPPLIDGKLVAAGIDRLAQPLHTEVGQLFGDRLQTQSNVVEFSSHVAPWHVGQTFTTNDSSRP